MSDEREDYQTRIQKLIEDVKQLDKIIDFKMLDLEEIQAAKNQKLKKLEEINSLLDQALKAKI